jgi:hypothetical protein
LFHPTTSPRNPTLIEKKLADVLGAYKMIVQILKKRVVTWMVMEGDRGGHMGTDSVFSGALN